MAVSRTQREVTLIPEPHGLCGNRIDVANHRGRQATTHDRRTTSE